MKRKISLVFLSLVLAFSTLFSLAFAITASADTTLVATFNLGDDGSGGSESSTAKSSYSETSGDYTFSFSDGSKVYPGSRDQKGNGSFKLGTGSVGASFSFTVPDDVVEVIVYVAARAKDVNVTINGISTTISVSEYSYTNGVYYAFKVDTSSTKTVSLSTSKGSDPRAYVDKIEYYATVAPVVPEDPDCTHEGTEVTTNTVDATCQKAGKTTVTCECGYVISETEIPVLVHTEADYTSEVFAPTCVAEGYTIKTCVCGFEEKVDVVGVIDHNYVDGACSECGAPDPALGVLFDFGEKGTNTDHVDGSKISAGAEFTSGAYTITLDSATNVYSKAYDLKQNSCLKLGTSSGTASFSFTVPSDVVKVIFMVAQYKTNATTVKVNGTESIISTASNNGEYTAVSVDTSATKTVTFETVSSKNRCMIDSIFFVVSAGDPECQHEKTEEVIVNPTCQAEGSKTINCADCGAFISSEPIAKLDSCAYGDDGICTMCGAPDPTNVGAILKALYALESGATLPGTYTLTGVITAIPTAYNAEYNNITVDILVEGYDDMPVRCYRLAGEGVDQIAVGDTITVTGSLTNYSNGTYEFTQGCTLDSWVDNTTEPVLPTETNIAGVQAGEIGVTYKVVGATVVAVNAQSFLAKDESGYILVYLGSEWTADVKVGDVVTLEGASGAYAKSVQFAKETTYTVTGSAEYQAPTAEVIDGAKIDEIAGAASITPDAYVTLSGTLNISGNYYNVVVDGTNVIVSITYPNADQAAALAALNGKKVEFTGYVTGYNNYLNLLATSFEEIVPEVETKIAGTSLNVGNDLTFLYFVSLANGEDINRYSIKVEMNGKSYELSFSDMINGYYVFAFEGIAPQCMGDSIDAYLIKKGGEVVSSRTGYSVKAYLTDLVNDENNKDNSALLTLAADILAYGAAAQKYVDYNSDNLVNAGFPVAGSELDPAEATDRKVITKNDHENTYVSGLGVRFDYVNSIFVKVVAPSIEGVTLKINGQEVELVAYGNGYIGYSAGVSALKFDGDIQVELSLNGELVSIIEYSVNSYILTKYAGESAMAELATALYRYGASAVAYNNSLAN